MNASALYSGTVMHRRLRPRGHRLRYRVFSLLLDLDDLDALDRRLRLLSVNRRNLFSFHEADHGDASAPRLRAQVDGWMQRAGLPAAGRVRLLTMPRLLGYAFNPLSVYFCDAPHGGALQAIVYEVNSTFGERHHYVIPVTSHQAREAAAGTAIHQACAKRMHVSPFLGMDLQYRFTIRPPSDTPDARLQVGVDVHDGQGPLLLAAHVAHRHPLTDARLLLALAAHPLLTFKVIAAIHWEALLLWAGRVPLQPRPPRAERSFTIAPPHP